MFKFNKIIIIMFLFYFAGFTFGDTKSDLQNRTRQLNQLKQNLNNKKEEKARLLKEEQKVKKELNKISSSISNTEKQLKSLQIKITDVEKKLVTASKDYSAADEQKHTFAQIIEDEFLKYNQRKLIKYFDYPFEFKVRYLSIQDKTEKYNIAENKGKIAQSNIGKYDKTKKNLLGLKQQQQKLIEKNKRLQKDKNKLLKTTAGKRVKAEQDIKEINDSARALESLVKKLMKASKQQKNITSLRSKSAQRKHNLPWPVEGQIVLNYGKNKHPDLDTNVISNGIKIKAQNNAIIKSVDEGIVAFTGEFRSYGKMVIIDHRGVFFSVYGQLNNILVSEDIKVLRGDSVANLGTEENSVLYFEIRQNNVPENPELWLKEKKQ